MDEGINTNNVLRMFLVDGNVSCVSKYYCHWVLLSLVQHKLTFALVFTSCVSLTQAETKQFPSPAVANGITAGPQCMLLNFLSWLSQLNLKVLKGSNICYFYFIYAELTIQKEHIQ